MSAHVEWGTARDLGIGWTDPDFHDAYGTGVDPGLLGLALDTGSGLVVIEGTRAELLEVAAAIQRCVASAPDA